MSSCMRSCCNMEPVRAMTSFCNFRRNGQCQTASICAAFASVVLITFYAISAQSEMLPTYFTQQTPDPLPAADPTYKQQQRLQQQQQQQLQYKASIRDTDVNLLQEKADSGPLSDSLKTKLKPPFDKTEYDESTSTSTTTTKLAKDKGESGPREETSRHIEEENGDVYETGGKRKRIDIGQVSKVFQEDDDEEEEEEEDDEEEKEDYEKEKFKNEKQVDENEDEDEKEDVDEDEKVEDIDTEKEAENEEEDENKKEKEIMKDDDKDDDEETTESNKAPIQSNAQNVGEANSEKTVNVGGAYSNTIAKVGVVKPSGTAQEQGRSLAPPSRSRGHVLLVTYGRSGSSFTSAIISSHPSVFYTFEPLYYLKKTLGDKEPLWQNTEQEQSRNIIKSFLTCDFQDARIFKNMHLSNSKDTMEAYKCLTQRTDGFSHLDCFLKLWQSCKSHTETLVKTIRFPIVWAKWFLEKYPNFKLLFLIRDPRAVLKSQSTVFKSFSWMEGIDSVSKSHCTKLKQDLEAFQILRKLYPDRIKAIRYEDGAMKPMEFTEDIYNFLGLELTDEVKNAVEQMTSTTRDGKSRSYSVYRKNPVEAMNKWRYDAGFKSVHIVDQNCERLYPLLGYSSVTSQKDLESNRPLVGEPSEGTIFVKSTIS